MSTTLQAPVVEQTVIFQLKIPNKDCLRKLKKWLLEIQGVHSVDDFDVKRGMVIISGTKHPHTLIMMLENYGVKPEIYANQRPISAVNDRQIINVAQPRIHDPHIEPKPRILKLFKPVEAPVVEQTVTFQLKIPNKDCGRKLKKWLLEIQGVHSVDFDVKGGMVIISGTKHPQTLIMMLENYGVKPEIYGQQRHISPVNDRKIIVAQPKVNDLHIERRPRIPATFKPVEVTGKIVKLDCWEQGNNGGHGVYHKPHGGSSSYCGDLARDAGVSYMHCYPHGSPHRNGNISSENSGRKFTSMPQPEYEGFSPLLAPPWVAVAVPSAPPLPEDDYSPASRPPPPPPPPGTDPIYEALSDDNTSSSCTIM